MVLGFCLRTLKEEHLLAAKVITIQTYGYAMKEKNIYLHLFVAYTVKGGGSSFAWQRRQSLRLQILRIILILEEKQVHRLLLVQGLNAHNWMHTMDLRENGTVELLSPAYMKNFYFSNSPGTMAQPPLTRFSSVGADILMPGIFILGNLW